MKSIERVRARDTGVEAPGASKSRFILTTGGSKHVKFLRSDGEGPHALASELLTTLIMRLLEVERAGLALVELPPLLLSTEAFRTVFCPLGLGTASLFSQDLVGSLIAAAARQAPTKEIVAQYIVLDWVRSEDHLGKNFLFAGDRVIAIDFSAAPSERTWVCHPFEQGTPDHGMLGNWLSSVGRDIRMEVIELFDRIDRSMLEDLASAIPTEWAKGEEVSKLIEKLLARKEEVRARYST